MKKMTLISEAEWREIASAGHPVPANICEPPCTLVYDKPGGKQIALAKWYDGSAYHDHKKPEFYKVEE